MTHHLISPLDTPNEDDMHCASPCIRGSQLGAYRTRNTVFLWHKLVRVAV
jgi:hypothetical protein